MPLQVLVADDEPAILKIVRRLLERSGHDVATAATASDALALLESRAFDVALVDDHMPGSGRTVLEALSNRPDFTGRMYLMSGEPPRDPGTLPEGTRHLPKPFAYPELLSLVEGSD